MKKILCVILALILLFSFAACMSKNSGEPQSTSEAPTSMRDTSGSTSSGGANGGDNGGASNGAGSAGNNASGGNNSGANGGAAGGTSDNAGSNAGGTSSNAGGAANGDNGNAAGGANNGGANGNAGAGSGADNGNAGNGNNNDTSTSARMAPMNNSTEVEVSNGLSAAGGSDMIIKGTSGGSSLSGLLPLNSVSYSVEDPNNKRGLSTKKICHSHGPSSGGEPHHTVVEFQNTFDKYGALTLDRKTKGKVLYLTFDCGWEYENLTSDVLDTLKEKNVPAAFFCTLDHMKKQPELIARMIKDGHIVGNHSNSHPSFAEISRTQMKDEIEETENFLRKNFGYCSKYFRFPAGEYNESALDLVSSLGYMSVFWSVAYDDWNVDSVKGKDYAVKVIGERLHDGAIILLHAVSKDNAAALGEIIDNARAEGYEFKALTDYKG